MFKWPFAQDEVRLLPYPDKKTFAFTIIDDTDGATLETVRPVYECLFSLGLRTTKTVWVKKPNTPPQRAADAGDTLERPEYADYIQLLLRRGFEIALHNVSSQSSQRPEIAAAIDRFKQLVGGPPKINVQHGRNLENLYFEFAQSGRHLPSPFRTTAFQRLYGLWNRTRAKATPASHGCSGEDSRSVYFWGDLCQTNIKYVRSNVFFRDLNTLKCSPHMPYVAPEAPYVRYWFDSSNGQDADCFNSILADRNIQRLRGEHGCCVLYTHFGAGFVVQKAGAFELNAESQRRLRAMADCADGWYAPVSAVLERLLAFQNVAVFPLSGGVLIGNRNSYDISSVTLLGTAGRTYCDLAGRDLTADQGGRIILERLPAGGTSALLCREAYEPVRRWQDNCAQGWMLDLKTAVRKAGGLLERHVKRHHRG